jgi:hypothetical protein
MPNKLVRARQRQSVAGANADVDWLDRELGACAFSDERLGKHHRTVTIKELEDHLRAAVSMLTKRDVTIAALDSRLAAAQQETENYRQRLAMVIQRAVTRRPQTALKRVSKTMKPARLGGRATPKGAKRKGVRKHR